MSLEKWSIEKGWILCNMDGLQCSINCPQFKWGTTPIGEDHFIAFPAEERVEKTPNAWLIINHQNLRHGNPPGKQIYPP